MLSQKALQDVDCKPHVGQGTTYLSPGPIILAAAARHPAMAMAVSAISTARVVAQNAQLGSIGQESSLWSTAEEAVAAGQVAHNVQRGKPLHLQDPQAPHRAAWTHAGAARTDQMV